MSAEPWYSPEDVECVAALLLADYDSQYANNFDWTEFAPQARTLLDSLAPAIAARAARIARQAKAEALREAATLVRNRRTSANAEIGPNGRYFERQAIYKTLRARAAQREAGDGDE